MEKNELIEKLSKLPQGYSGGDLEQGHEKADDLLLEFINDPEITKAFQNVGKYYA